MIPVHQSITETAVYIILSYGTDYSAVNILVIIPVVVKKVVDLPVH